MDDIRPRPQRQNVNSYPSRVNNQPNPSYNQPISPQPISQPEEPISHDVNNDFHLPESKPKKSGKGKNIALIFLIILFIASVGAIAYLYFIAMPQIQKDYDDSKADNARLIQRIDSLEYDNRDLQKKLEMSQASANNNNLDDTESSN